MDQESMGRIKTLHEQAKLATGFEDFGDESYREGLERLVASIDAEARLNAQGEAMANHQILDLLSWRLRIEHWYARHPEIESEEIIAPLIGLGLPRTGSTAFSCMLAEDPGFRTIRAWESSAPCPPPETATEHSDPRIEEQKVRMAYMDHLAPRLKMMLPVSPTAPTECQQFMGYDFRSQIFQASLRIPTYVAWLNYEADLVPTYRYVKRVLKLLQWRCGPSHIVFINALDKVFPDARYWMTHRDIARVIPSVVDLYQELSRPFTDEMDIAYIADLNLGWTELGLHRVNAFRDGGQDHRFFDVDFAEFQSDPMPVIARLYTFLGETLTEETREKMLNWRRAMPADKHGAHKYEMASLGIDMDSLRSRFSFYDRKHEAAAPAR
jgi:hypothetical protein